MSTCEKCAMISAPDGVFHCLAARMREIEENAEYILSIARKDLTEAGVTRWRERRDLVRGLLAEIEGGQKYQKGEVKV